MSGKHTFRCVTPPRTRTTQCNSICVMPPMTCRALAAIKTSPVRPGPFVVISNAPGTDNYYWMLIVLHLWHFRNIFIGTWASVYITIIYVAEFMELLCCDQWCYQWFILFCVFCKHCFTLKKKDWNSDAINFMLFYVFLNTLLRDKNDLTSDMSLSKPGL